VVGRGGGREPARGGRGGSHRLELGLGLLPRPLGLLLPLALGLGRSRGGCGRGGAPLGLRHGLGGLRT